MSCLRSLGRWDCGFECLFVRVYSVCVLPCV
jgi:hypothetical protein